MNINSNSSPGTNARQWEQRGAGAGGYENGGGWKVQVCFYLPHTLCIEIHNFLIIYGRAAVHIKWSKQWSSTGQYWTVLHCTILDCTVPYMYCLYFTAPYLYWTGFFGMYLRTGLAFIANWIQFLCKNKLYSSSKKWYAYSRKIWQKILFSEIKF